MRPASVPSIHLFYSFFGLLLSIIIRLSSDLPSAISYQDIFLYAILPAYPYVHYHLPSTAAAREARLLILLHSSQLRLATYRTDAELEKKQMRADFAHAFGDLEADYTRREQDIIAKYEAQIKRERAQSTGRARETLQASARRERQMRQDWAARSEQQQAIREIPLRARIASLEHQNKLLRGEADTANERADRVEEERRQSDIKHAEDMEEGEAKTKQATDAWVSGVYMNTEMYYELRAAKEETVHTELQAIRDQCTTKRTRARFAAYVKKSKQALGRAARTSERLRAYNRALVRRQRQKAACGDCPKLADEVAALTSKSEHIEAEYAELIELCREKTTCLINSSNNYLALYERNVRLDQQVRASEKRALEFEEKHNYLFERCEVLDETIVQQASLIEELTAELYERDAQTRSSSLPSSRSSSGDNEDDRVFSPTPSRPAGDLIPATTSSSSYASSYGSVIIGTLLPSSLTFGWLATAPSNLSDLGDD